jgi:N-acetylmuramoyl-L-alanine amidase
MSYAISVHRLSGSIPGAKDTRFIESPNRGATFVPSSPTLIVEHYTAGPSLDGTVRSFSDPERKASSQLVIDRDGTIVQMVDLNRVAWHAGESSWQNMPHVNLYSIGIEHVNAGLLKKVGSKYVAWWGGVIPDKEVTIIDGAPWHAYTQQQLAASLEVQKVLIGTYKTITDIVAHSDIAPGRKIDTGPAFPLSNFRGILFGRC